MRLHKGKRAHRRQISAPITASEDARRHLTARGRGAEPPAAFLVLFSQKRKKYRTNAFALAKPKPTAVKRKA